MSPRDEFAAAALTGLLAQAMGAPRPSDVLVKEAYILADEMIRQQAKTEPVHHTLSEDVDYENVSTSKLLDALEAFNEWPHFTKYTQRLLLAAIHRLEVFEGVEKQLAELPKLP